MPSSPPPPPWSQEFPLVGLQPVHMLWWPNILHSFQNRWASVPSDIQCLFCDKLFGLLLSLQKVSKLFFDLAPLNFERCFFPHQKAHQKNPIVEDPKTKTRLQSVTFRAPFWASATTRSISATLLHQLSPPAGCGLQTMTLRGLQKLEVQLFCQPGNENKHINNRDE